MAVPIVVLVFTVIVPPTIVTALVPKSPMNVAVPFQLEDSVPVLVIVAKLAASVSSKSVTATFPSPAIDLPEALAAVVVRVLLLATVTLAVPKSPVKVTSSSHKALSVVGVKPDRSAAAVPFKLRTFIVPDPSTVKL